MIARTGFGVRSVFGVNIIFWTPVAACGCGVVVDVNRLFVPLCFGVDHGEKLTRLVVVAVVGSLFLLLLFIIDCGDSNVLSILRLAAFVCTYSSERLPISKA